MRKQTPLNKEIDQLLGEIHAEEEAVPLSPWTLTSKEVMDWDKEELDWDRGKRNYGLTDLCDADTPQKLNEASLGHLYWQYLESKAESFAIIPDCLKAETKQNKKKIKRLIDKIKSDNYLGLWGHSQEDGSDKNKIHVVEPYRFLIGFPLDIVRDSVEHNGQYSILYCGSETDGHIKNYDHSGTVDDIGAFHPNRIAQFFTKRLGSPIVFETLISGWIGGYGALRHGIKEVPGIRKANKLILKTVRNDSF
jgi:hypothetical protein